MIILMGVAGAGKSVQGKWLADELGLPWLSTGEFLRMLVTGERRKEMLAGKLLSDTEMIELADKIFHMIEIKQEFVLDGFPRTIGQAEWLLAQHKAGLLEITRVLHIEATEDVVAERLLARGRQDDTKESIAARFAEYRAVTLPILKDFEANRLKVHHLNGERLPDVVHQEIMEILQ